MSELIRRFKTGELEVFVFASTEVLAAAAVRAAREHLEAALNRAGQAAAIFATGNSQIRFLDQLAQSGGIDWSRVTLFHMDEYLGLPPDHPASFRRYLKERVERTLSPGTFHYLAGDALEPIRECDRYTQLLRAQPIDLCCLGIGENGHLAFNDPPVADFQDERLVKIVKLDTTCKQQQVGEGHFPHLDAVPSHALTLTIPALCSARRMICIVPEQRKATAVRGALQGPISTSCPASILRRQSHCTLFLDTESASLL